MKIAYSSRAAPNRRLIVAAYAADRFSGSVSFRVTTRTLPVFLARGICRQPRFVLRVFVVAYDQSPTKNVPPTNEVTRPCPGTGNLLETCRRSFLSSAAEPNFIIRNFGRVNVCSKRRSSSVMTGNFFVRKFERFVRRSSQKKSVNNTRSD